MKNKQIKSKQSDSTTFRQQLAIAHNQLEQLEAQLAKRTRSNKQNTMNIKDFGRLVILAYPYGMAPDTAERIAQSVIDAYLKTDDMLKKRVHELIEENTELRKELEALKPSKERQEFEQWWSENATTRTHKIGESFTKNCSFEAWKAARKSK